MKKSVLLVSISAMGGEDIRYPNMVRFVMYLCVIVFVLSCCVFQSLYFSFMLAILIATGGKFTCLLLNDKY